MTDNWKPLSEVIDTILANMPQPQKNAQGSNKSFDIMTSDDSLMKSTTEEI